LKICNAASDPFVLICSDSESMGRAEAEAADERKVREFLEDAHAFSTSFSTGGLELQALGIDFEGLDQLLKKVERCFGNES